jgi:hypothetical protein
VEIGSMFGVGGNAVKKFARVHFGMEIRMSDRYRLWNDTEQCYEYYTEFPMSIYELKSAILQGQTIEQLACKYHVSYTTFRRQLNKCFGTEIIDELLR